MRKIIANISWIFFDKIFRMVAGILVGVWIARYLGPSDFGILNYAILFPTILSSVAGLGLTNVLMVEYVAVNNDLLKQHALVSNGIVMKLVGGVLMYTLVICLNYIFNRDNAILFLLINITGLALILQSSDVVDTYFQAHTKAKLSVIVKLIAFALAATARIYGLLTYQSITFFVIVNVTELGIGYGLVMGAYKYFTGRSIVDLFRSIDLQVMRNLVQISWPIMLTDFFVFIYMRIDQFMIESLSSNRELGLYGAALRLSEAWYFIAIAVTTSFYPKIAELWSERKEDFYIRYQELLNVLSYISITLAIFVTLFSTQIITVIYGVEFKNASNILSVHIWAGVFVFTGVGTNNLMIINKLQRFVLVKTIAGAVINILLNLWAIPKFGAIGASVVTLISYGLQSYGMNFLLKRARPVFKLQSQSFINFITLRKPLSFKVN